MRWWVLVLCNARKADRKQDNDDGVWRQDMTKMMDEVLEYLVKRDGLLRSYINHEAWQLKCQIG